MQSEDESDLEKCEDRKGQPEDAKPVILMIGSGDPDLADGRNFRDQVGLVPAKKELGQRENKQAAARA